jgi:hypothetical protein
MYAQTESVAGIAGVKLAEPAKSEIEKESTEIEAVTQATFEAARELHRRLSPLFQPSPESPNKDPRPEGPMSEFGSRLRAHRQAIESIHATLVDALNALAL